MENNPINLTWLWGILAAAGSSAVTWLFTRKKQEAEVKTNELDNVEKAVEIWREMASDLRGQFSAVQTELLALQKEVIEVRYDNARLKEENAALKANQATLQAEIDELKAKVKP